MDIGLYALLGILAAILVGAPLVAGRLRELQLSQAGLGHATQLTDEQMLAHMTRVLSALGYRVQRSTEAEPEFDLILVDGLGHKSGVSLHRWRASVDDSMVAAVAEAGRRLGKAAPMIVSIDRYTQKARETAKATGVVLWGVADLTRAIHKVRQTAVAYPDLPPRPGLPGAKPVALVAMPRLVRKQPTSRSKPPSEEDEVEQSRRALSVITGYDRAVRKRQRARRREDDDDAPRCPRCGKLMVLRQGKNGEYWSCPSFPRCLGSRAK